MKIALGSDHAGFKLKQVLARYLCETGRRIQDFGTFTEDPCDYPDFVRPAAESVARGDSALGIVLGGSGNGEAMAANKVAGIRCAVVWNTESARLARQHNDANMIALGERLVSSRMAIWAVEAWLSAEYEAGRHRRRLEKIAAWEAEGRG
jgi:ribose 5-phosphate isomerase B